MISLAQEVKMRSIWSTERKIVVGFGSVLLAMCIVTSLSVWVIFALLRDLQSVADRDKILTRISEANGLAPQVATYARMLAVNHDPATFEEWEKHEIAFETKLTELAALTRESPTQQERLTKLRRLLHEKVLVTTPSASRRTLEDAWGIRKGHSEVVPLIDLLGEMSDEERDVLRMRNRQALYEARLALWIMGTASLLGLILFAGALRTILRDLRTRRRAAAELDRAREAAEAASVAKSAFLANMSHELRTPLTSIMGYVDLMLGTAGDAAAHREYLQTVRRSGEHLLTLIRDILDVSKIEAGRMEVESVECRLLDLLGEVCSLMRARALQKGIAFQVEYMTPMPDRARTDPTRFRQILMNLVGNAIKFTDEGSVRIEVSCRQANVEGSGFHVVVEVIDTGVGISPEQQRHLFQPFHQADPSTTRRFGGTGLGLSISRRLAQRLGGVLTVRSELDQGSTFRLSLPVEAVDGAATIAAGHSLEPIQGVERTPVQVEGATGLRVLLAEDGSENRDVIILHLRNAGCVATGVEDGQQAYESALGSWQRGEAFDVVLMDMQMPVMDGYTATARLRAQGYAGVIIALTAHAMKEDRERCLSVGCDDYATKPVNVPALLQMMARLSGRVIGSETVVDRLLQNPALHQLTRKFCAGLTPNLTQLGELAARSAWSELAAGAHRLAGAGGAFGFDAITRDAKALERAACGENTAEVTGALERLRQACAAAQGRVENAPASPDAGGAEAAKGDHSSVPPGDSSAGAAALETRE